MLRMLGKWSTHLLSMKIENGFVRPLEVQIQNDITHQSPLGYLCKKNKSVGPYKNWYVCARGTIAKDSQTLGHRTVEQKRVVYEGFLRMLLETT